MEKEERTRIKSIYSHIVVFSIPFHFHSISIQILILSSTYTYSRKLIKAFLSTSYRSQRKEFRCLDQKYILH